MQENRYDRQSFLGSDSQIKIEACTIGVVGLGGGGSHIVQQLAHIGFQNYVLYDVDVVQETNLNRLIGARENGLHPTDWTKYVRVVGRNQIPCGREKGTCHEAPKELCC